MDACEAEVGGQGRLFAVEHLERRISARVGDADWFADTEFACVESAAAEYERLWVAAARLSGNWAHSRAQCCSSESHYE